MLHYLKIFSWFLLTFGVVGVGAIVIGVDPGIGTGPDAMGVMVLQVAIALTIFCGFKLNKVGKLGRKALVYGGWGLVLLLIVAGSVWMNVSGAPEAAGASSLQNFRKVTPLATSIDPSRLEQGSLRWYFMTLAPKNEHAHEQDALSVPEGKEFPFKYVCKWWNFQEIT